ncbi:hypothetical protein SAMN06298216_0973 [Spirosomataceae bacterium TFI 002]|nr:hypothetical protein SAMN06298216_0973 [Spirosomataceae bacterium TFI 002]
MSFKSFFSVIAFTLICLQVCSAKSTLDSLQNDGQCLYLKDSSSVTVKFDTLIFACKTQGLSLYFTGCGQQEVRWNENYVGDSIFINSNATLHPRCGLNTHLDSSKFATVVLFDEPPIKPTVTINRNVPELCQNSGVWLTSNCNGYEPETIWQDSISAIQFQVTTDGIYKAVCRNQCGTGESTYTNVTNGNNDVKLKVNASKLSICTGDISTLEAIADGNILFRDHLIIWSNGSSDSIINVTEPGLYSYQIAPFCQDTLKSEIIEIVKGVETPVVEAYNSDNLLLTGPVFNICSQDSIRLAVNNCVGTVNWNNGLSGSSIYTHSSGFYSANCTTSCGTSDESEIVAVDANECTISPPILDANSVVKYCTGSYATLIVSCELGHIVWEDPIHGSSSIIRVFDGEYKVSCVLEDSVSHPLSIFVNEVSLPNSPSVVTSKTTLCGNDVATLTANGCNGGSLVEWSSGETMAQITKNTSGTYTALCRNQCGSSQNSNEILITRYNNPEDVEISQETITAGNGTKSILLRASNCTTQTRWSTGEYAQSITVAPGNYTARCVNGCGFGVEVTIAAKFSELNCIETCIPIKVSKYRVN